MASPLRGTAVRRRPPDRISLPSEQSLTDTQSDGGRGALRRPVDRFGRRLQQNICISLRQALPVFRKRLTCIQ